MNGCPYFKYSIPTLISETIAHNSFKSFPIVPAGNEIVDAEGDTVLYKNVVETTLPNQHWLTNFQHLVNDRNTFNITTNAFTEVGMHKIGIYLQDDKGAYCTYDVYSVLVTNTAPYFVNP